MSECQVLDKFLDGVLSDSQRSRFVEHLAQCPACARTLARWWRVQAVLPAWVAAQASVSVSDHSVAKLVLRAEHRARPQPVESAGGVRRLPWRVPVPVAAAFALLFTTSAVVAATAVWLHERQTSQAPETPATMPARDPVSALVMPQPPESVEIAPEVPAPTAPTEAVPTGIARLRPMPARDARNQVPRRDLSGWQTLIVAGEVTRAQAELARYLAQVPGDVEAWLLSADAHRKAQHYQEAVVAYREVIRRGEPSARAHARLQAAILLQDKLGDMAASISLLEALVQQPPQVLVLRELASFRLARGYVDQGQRERARLLLQELARAATEPALRREAKTMLGELEPSR